MKRASTSRSGRARHSVRAVPRQKRMKRASTIQRAAFATLALACSWPDSLWACAACYGQADSPMAQGMNWGIFSLLAVVVLVLGAFAAFFVYLAKRAAAVSTTADHQSLATPLSHPMRSEEHTS